MRSNASSSENGGICKLEERKSNFSVCEEADLYDFRVYCTLYIWICCRRSQLGIGSGYVLLPTRSRSPLIMYMILYGMDGLSQKKCGLEFRLCKLKK